MLSALTAIGILRRTTAVCLHVLELASQTTLLCDKGEFAAVRAPHKHQISSTSVGHVPISTTSGVKYVDRLLSLLGGVIMPQVAGRLAVL